jgi:hypothetical protein
MTKIEITYDTETGYGSLKAYVGNGTGSWFLGGNLGPEIYALVTSRYGNLDGTGCGWSSPDDEVDAETFAEDTASVLPSGYSLTNPSACDTLDP